MFILESLPVLKKKKSRKSKGILIDEDTLGQVQAEIPFFIKPSEKIATIDSSKWPLLLKVNFSISTYIFVQMLDISILLKNNVHLNY